MVQVARGLPPGFRFRRNLEGMGLKRVSDILIRDLKNFSCIGCCRVVGKNKHVFSIEGEKWLTRMI